MKNIREFYQNLNYLFLLILGVSIISFVIYFRLIYKRLPRQLSFYIFENNAIVYNIPIIIFVSIFLVVSTTIIIFSVLSILRKTIKIKPTQFVLFWINIYTLIENSLYSVYCFITNKIPDGFDKIGNIIMLFFYSKISKFEIVIIPTLMIRSIICISFLYDVFICFKFEYFYKSLSFILILFLWELWIFIIKDWSTTNIEDAKSYLDITTFNEGLENESHSIKFSEKYKDLNLDLDYHIKIYSNLLTMVHFSEAYIGFKQYYTQRFNLVYYSLFLFGCIYIIFKNII